MKYFFFIMILVHCIILLVGFTACNSKRKVALDSEAMRIASQNHQPHIISEADLEDLPVAVKRWLKTTGVIGKKEIINVEVRQIAMMKTKPEQKEWYHAEATQFTSVSVPAFIWTVKMEMSPLITIHGRDRFDNGKGQMKMWVNNIIRVVNGKGDKLDHGTLIRYLGELVWYPTFALNPMVKWETIDDYSAKATLSINGTTGSGTFYFDDNGQFIRFETMRYLGADADAKKYNWIMKVDGYDTFEGIQIPSSMSATWVLDDGEWTWLKLKIADIRYNI